MTFTVTAAYSMASDLFNRYPDAIRTDVGHGWTRHAMTLSLDGCLYELSFMHHDGYDIHDFVIGPLSDPADREAFGPRVPDQQPRPDLARVIYHGTPEV